MSRVTVTVIDPTSEALLKVMQLHRADSHQLGFFPKGAFEDRARVQQILLAYDEGNDLLGYLLFRVTRGQATIVHLCTAPQARQKGVARLLVEHLKLITKPLTGIGLRCRQDYAAKHIWPKFGFTALHRQAGRSHDGHELTRWWFDHGHPDLFSLTTDCHEHRQKIAVDANVFFDFHSCDQRDSEDSRALLADWVQASIELCVTKEILNEIDRADSAEQRRRSQAALSGYPVLKSDDAIFQQTCEELKSLLPKRVGQRHESDLRQVAYAIAGNVNYLVTRDEKLVERCEPLYDRYGLQVIHPSELISRLDVIERETKYQPAWIEGSHLKSHALKATDVEMVTTAFRDATQEKKNDFQKKVRRYLGNPLEVEARYVIDQERRPVILGILHRSCANAINITMLRAAEHNLAATLMRNFLRNALELAAREDRKLIKVTDVAGGELLRDALVEFGFVEIKGEWIKIALRVVGDFENLQDAIKAVSEVVPRELLKATQVEIGEAKSSNAAMDTAKIESRLWPAKIIGTNLPTFIVSIRAEWARHFFDDELASQYLFGTRDELLLGIEGAYYCSAKHRYLTAPARILWYVSKGIEKTGSMSIKACSRLEEVMIGKPKELFKRFRRLGVYRWEEVYNAVRKNVDQDILAFRFSMTERFANPFSRNQLETLGIKQPLLSPRYISDSQFEKIYSHGCALK